TPHYQRLAATSWAALAEQLSSPQMFRIVEALAAHRKAVDYQRKVVAGPDALAIDHSVLGTALLGLARTLSRSPRPERARPMLESAICSHKKALSTNPGNPAYTRELRRCYLTTAELLLVAREYEPAARVADDVVHNFPATVESFADAATVLRWCVDVGDEEGLP